MLIMKKMPIAVETNFDFESKGWILKILKFLPLFIIRKYFYQVTYKYVKGELLELKIVNLLTLQRIFLAGFSSKQFDLIRNPGELEKSLENFAHNWLRSMLPIIESLYSKKQKIISTPGKRLLGISNFFYSIKNRKEVFDPIVSDWREEYFEALSKKQIWKACWINVSYTYALVLAMWQRSPIGDLIEFIVKLAKQ